MYFATLFPEAQIVGIEPEINNYKQFCKNTSAYSNIKPINAAIWHEESYVTIMNNEELSAGFVMEEGKAGATSLKAITIGSIMRENQFCEIDVLKLDIEGTELNLFSNNPHAWLGKTRCLIIELHDNLKPGTSQIFFREMSKYNWRTFIRGENIICFKAG